MLVENPDLAFWISEFKDFHNLTFLAKKMLTLVTYSIYLERFTREKVENYLKALIG